MANEPAVAPVRIESVILTIRRHCVMLDSDLAAVYGVTTKQLNQQMRRNPGRFPADFAFQLTAKEFAGLRSQIVTSNARGGRRYLPWVFTEHGAIMLASVLNSPVAIEASVRVVRAFVYLREQLAANKELAHKLAELEGRVGRQDQAIKDLFETIRQMIESTPDEQARREIGFHVREQAVRYRIRHNK